MVVGWGYVGTVVWVVIKHGVCWDIPEQPSHGGFIAMFDDQVGDWSIRPLVKTLGILQPFING